jgi:hypothetical protein
VKDSAIADGLTRQLLAVRTTVAALAEQIDAALVVANGLAENAHARENAAAALREDPPAGIVPDDDPLKGRPVFGRRTATDTAPPAAPAVT